PASRASVLPQVRPVACRSDEETSLVGHGVARRGSKPLEPGPGIEHQQRPRYTRRSVSETREWTGCAGDGEPTDSLRHLLRARQKMIATLDRRARQTIRRREVIKTAQPADAARRAAEDIQRVILLDQGRQTVNDRLSFGNEVGAIPENAQMSQGIDYPAPAVEPPDQAHIRPPPLDLALERGQGGAR